MTTGPRAAFERLCRRRGYTLEAVRDCIVDEAGDTITVDERHPSYPRAKPGLGDIVKAGLSAVGITEERVSRTIGRPCGCSQGVDALNTLGNKYFGMPPGSTDSGKNQH